MPTAFAPSPVPAVDTDVGSPERILHLSRASAGCIEGTGQVSVQTNPPTRIFTFNAPIDASRASGAKCRRNRSRGGWPGGVAQDFGGGGELVTSVTTTSITSSAAPCWAWRPRWGEVGLTPGVARGGWAGRRGFGLMPRARASRPKIVASATTQAARRVATSAKSATRPPMMSRTTFTAL